MTAQVEQADAPGATAASPSAPVVEATRLARAFGETRALVAADLRVERGEIHALVGENGSGKTTLIKALSGVLRPDAGELRVKGVGVSFGQPRAAQTAGISTVFQETLVAPELSVRDNVVLGIDGLFRRRTSGGDEIERCREALRSVGVDHVGLDRPLWSLSLAERQLVTIARAISRPWDLLILDEGTSALDAGQRDTLFDYLRAARLGGKSVLFTSHRMDEVTQLADAVTVLRLGTTVERAAIGDTSPHRMLTLMANRAEVEAAERRPAPRVRAPREAAAPRLRTVDLQIREDAAPIALEFGRGEIVGLAGLEGHGQVEFAERLSGLGRSRARGSVEVVDAAGDWAPVRRPRDARRRRIAYVPRDRKQEGLFFPLSILDNFSLTMLADFSTLGVIKRRAVRRRFEEHAGRLRLAAGRANELVGVLSGGNQQKVLLGRWLATEPQVLVLNDPLRGVDVNTKEELYELFRGLAAEGMTIVLVSTEILELLALSDRIAVFHRGGVHAVLDAAGATEERVIAAMFGEEVPA